MSDTTDLDPYSKVANLQRNVAALSQQANHYQGVVEAQGQEIAQLKRTTNQQVVDIAQMKDDLLRLRMSLVGRGPTAR